MPQTIISSFLTHSPFSGPEELKQALLIRNIRPYVNHIHFTIAKQKRPILHPFLPSQGIFPAQGLIRGIQKKILPALGVLKTDYPGIRKIKLQGVSQADRHQVMALISEREQLLKIRRVKVRDHKTDCLAAGYPVQILQ